MKDRILEIADLLMGAAHADDELRQEEATMVRGLLARLLEADEIPAEVAARVKAFDPKKFDLTMTASQFAGDPTEDKRKLLELVASVHEADDELDLAEDEYLGSLARALGLAEEEFDDLELDYEVEELRDHLRDLRKPPPIPTA